MDNIEIFKLFGSILINNDKANESIQKTEQKAGGLASKLGGGIATAAKWGSAVGVAAGAVGGAMMYAANKAAGAADEVDKSSRRAGTSAENWQKLNYAFGQSGIESSKLEQTMIRNQKSLNDAAEGGKTATEAYSKLGVSIKDADGNLRKSDDVYRDVLNNLADLEDKNLRNSIANDIFGKSYGDLAPILDSGSDGIEALTSRADELGLVMSQEAVDAGVKFGDTLDDVKQAGGRMFVSIAGELLPVLQKFLDWIIAHMPEIREVTGKVFEVIRQAVQKAKEIFEAIQPVLQIIWDFIVFSFPTISKVVSTVFDAVVDTINDVVDVFTTVTGVIKKAYEWLTSWNDKDAESKTLEVEEKGTGRGKDGTYASGLAFVPHDGYIAELHKGERVLNRGEVANQNNQPVINITVTGNNISSDYDVDRIGDKLASKIMQENRRLANRTSLIPI